MSGSVKSRRLGSGTDSLGGFRCVTAVKAGRGKVRHEAVSQGGFGWVWTGALRPVMEWRLLSGVLWSGQVRWGKAVELWKGAISYGLGW